MAEVSWFVHPGEEEAEGRSHHSSFLTATMTVSVTGAQCVPGCSGKFLIQGDIGFLYVFLP